MALRKIIEIEGEAFIRFPHGEQKLGKQKSSFLAYCKITNISADKQSGRIIVECKGDNQSIKKQYGVPLSVEDNAPNFIKQAYMHLKTLPEWADATDC